MRERAIVVNKVGKELGGTTTSLARAERASEVWSRDRTRRELRGALCLDSHDSRLGSLRPRLSSTIRTQRTNDETSATPIHLFSLRFPPSYVVVNNPPRPSSTGQWLDSAALHTKRPARKRA